MEAPIITNFTYGSRPGGPGSAGSTTVAVESNLPLHYVFESQSPLRPVLRLPGALIRINGALLAVHDGLLADMEVSRDGDGVLLTLRLEHPTITTARVIPGLPARLVLELSRAPLWRIMHGRRILIDAGHGGDDPGGRGPIDLLEKKMTLAVAVYLRKHLLGLGCLAAMTRDGDQNPSWQDRCRMAVETASEIMVSLHNGWSSDPAAAGISTTWLNEAGRPLAACIHAASLLKLALPDRGLRAGTPAAPLAIPAVMVEFATISNPVEEGWLRSATFLQRAAGAAANGIKDCFIGRCTQKDGGLARNHF